MVIALLLAASCGTRAEPTCSLFFAPLFSGLLPGLGQALDGRESAPVYLGVMVGGFGAYASVANTDPNLEGDGRQQRAFVYGQLAQSAGFLSAYDTYRYRTRLLGMDDALPDVPHMLLAPAHFERLLQWRVALPLAAAVALSALEAFPLHSIHGRDAATALSVSWMAGTTEEPLFRGFLLHYMDRTRGLNPWLANGIQSIAFSAAHGDFQPAAFAFRVAFGFYMGWLAQSSDYDLIDGAFVHAWWDTIVITTTLIVDRREGMVVSLPAVRF